MALAKKGTRCITVNEQIYRWVISPNDEHMVLVVELANDPGQQLKAIFDYQNIFIPTSGDLAIARQLRSITPEVVKNVIIEGLKQGWKPSMRKLPVFHIGDRTAKI